MIKTAQHMHVTYVTYTFAADVSRCHAEAIISHMTCLEPPVELSYIMWCCCSTSGATTHTVCVAAQFKLVSSSKLCQNESAVLWKHSDCSDRVSRMPRNAPAGDCMRASIQQSVCLSNTWHIRVTLTSKQSNGYMAEHRVKM